MGGKGSGRRAERGDLDVGTDELKVTLTCSIRASAVAFDGDGGARLPLDIDEMTLEVAPGDSGLMAKTTPWRNRITAYGEEAPDQ